MGILRIIGVAVAALGINRLFGWRKKTDLAARYRLAQAASNID